MGCVCCSLSTFVSIVLQALERISLCTVCCMLVCCLLFTIICVMVLGIGIGFHYCTVQNNVDAMKKAAQAAGALRSGPERRAGQEEKAPLLRSVDKAVKRGFAHRVYRQRRSGPDGDIPQTNFTLNANLTSSNNTFISSFIDVVKFNTTV